MFRIEQCKWNNQYDKPLFSCQVYITINTLKMVDAVENCLKYDILLLNSNDILFQQLSTIFTLYDMIGALLFSIFHSALYY